MRWRCPLDTGFEIRALAVSGRARYLLVTEAPTILNLYEWAGKKHFVPLKLEGQSGVQLLLLLLLYFFRHLFCSQTQTLRLSKSLTSESGLPPSPSEYHCPDHNTPSPWPLSVNDTAQTGRLTRGNDHHRYTDITSVTDSAGIALAQRPWRWANAVPALYYIVMDTARDRVVCG